MLPLASVRLTPSYINKLKKWFELILNEWSWWLIWYNEHSYVLCRPLHEATEHGNLEMMRLLLSYGADPLLATYSGLTPLSLAHNPEARALLQAHLADVQGLPSTAWKIQLTGTTLPTLFLQEQN